MIEDFVRPLRKQVAVLAVTATVLTGAPAAAAGGLVVRARADSQQPVPTGPELETFRKKVRGQWLSTKRDADRVAYLMLLIDYAKASLSESVSQGERQYRLGQLQTFVANRRSDRDAARSRFSSSSGGSWEPPDVERRAGPHADPICYHEGQEAECATDEEIAETQALADSAVYQNEENQRAYDEVMLMIGGLTDHPAAERSGPSAAGACEDCFSEAATATATMAASVAAVLGWEGAKADALKAGARLSKATRWSWHLTIITTSLTAGYYLGSLIDCSRNRAPVAGAAPATEQAWFALPRP